MITAILNLISQYAEANNVTCVIQASPVPLARERLESDTWYVYAIPSQASYSRVSREGGAWDLTIIAYFYRKKRDYFDISFPFGAIEYVTNKLYESNTNVASVSIERDLEIVDLNDDLFYAILEIENTHV